MSRDPDPQTLAVYAHGIVNQVRPLLAGQPPEVVSAVLATLVATWVAGHRQPAERERRRRDLLEAVLGLIPADAREPGALTLLGSIGERSN